MNDRARDPRQAGCASVGCAACVHDAGEGVPLGETTRRDFVRDAAITLAALFAAGGMRPRELAALPFEGASGQPGAAGVVTYPLPTADRVPIDRDNEIILVRWNERLYAFALSCPHQRTMLKWREKDTMFQCTKHKSKYLPDGTFVSGRATRGMDRYRLRVSGAGFPSTRRASFCRTRMGRPGRRQRRF